MIVLKSETWCITSILAQIFNFPIYNEAILKKDLKRNNKQAETTI